MCDQKDMGDPSATASCHMRDTRARDFVSSSFSAKVEFFDSFHITLPHRQASCSTCSPQVMITMCAAFLHFQWIKFIINLELPELSQLVLTRKSQILLQCH